MENILKDLHRLIDSRLTTNSIVKFELMSNRPTIIAKYALAIADYAENTLALSDRESLQLIKFLCENPEYLDAKLCTEASDYSYRKIGGQLNTLQKECKNEAMSLNDYLKDCLGKAYQIGTDTLALTTCLEYYTVKTISLTVNLMPKPLHQPMLSDMYKIG